MCRIRSILIEVSSNTEASLFLCLRKADSHQTAKTAFSLAAAANELSNDMSNTIRSLFHWFILFCLLFVILMFVSFDLDKMNQRGKMKTKLQLWLNLVYMKNTLAMNPNQNWCGSLAFTRGRAEVIRYESDPTQNEFAFVAGSKLMRIAEQKCTGSLRARVNGRLIRNTFCIGSKVIRYRVNGV